MTALNGMEVVQGMGKWSLPCLLIVGSSTESMSTDLKMLVPFMVVKHTKHLDNFTLPLTLPHSVKIFE